MGRKIKIIKGKAKRISREAIRLARQLHKEEHFIVAGKIESKHNLNEYYYFMACQLIIDLKKEIKEVSKQQKYLWQTLENVIEVLKKK